jgi:hypothetical protein
MVWSHGPAGIPNSSAQAYELFDSILAGNPYPVRALVGFGGNSRNHGFGCRHRKGSYGPRYQETAGRTEKKGIARANLFSWEETARNTLWVYKEVIANKFFKQINNFYK